MRVQYQPNKEEIKERIDLFVEEIVSENPSWVADRRVNYLENKLIKILKQIFFWLCGANKYRGWFGKTIVEANVEPDWRIVEKIEKEINLYRCPIKIDYDKSITNENIESASRVDCAELLEIKKRISGKNWAICPFHNDHNPSLLCYPDGKGFYCFACGVGGDAINLVRKLYNYSFQEAVKYLNR